MKSYFTNEKMPFLQAQEQEILSQLESILFAAGEAVSAEQIAEGLELTAEEMTYFVQRLHEEYASPQRGIRLIEMNGSLQLVTKQRNYQALQAVLSREKQRVLSKAGYEALAIVAYKQPITRVEVDAIRGVNSAGAIARLTDQGLIEEAGKKEVPGRPYLYRTTDAFLKLIGIRTLDELPSYDEFAQQILPEDDMQEERDNTEQDEQENMEITQNDE